MSQLEVRFEQVARVVDFAEDPLCMGWRSVLQRVMPMSDFDGDFASLIVDTAVLEGLHIPDSPGMLADINYHAMTIARTNDMTIRGEQ